MPPLAIDGPTLTIRKFKKDKLTLDQLVKFGSISPEGAEILHIIGHCRANILISGGTGSGKTTLLNCLTAFIDADERIITCEDAAELQLQQPHVVRLETRPPNLEGEGQVTMRDLVKNCLRMRPERIIVGEVRGPEAFDLLQAMNTGHDGSMGTLHANTPREALSRLESMITMGGFTLPSKTIREMIVASVDVVDPGRAPARRFAPHHAHHRGDRHRRRRRSSRRTSSSTRCSARTRTAGSSAATARPASAVRASGSARAISATSSGSAPRSTPPRSSASRIRSLTMPIETLAIFMLVALAAGGVIWVFVYPILSGERQAERRQRASRAGARPARVTGGQRRARRCAASRSKKRSKELELREKKAKHLAAADAHRSSRAELVASANSSSSASSSAPCCSSRGFVVAARWSARLSASPAGWHAALAARRS